jgi:division protein CdvB (Snf7/Vps24/ESCRT-III family)
MAPFDIGYASAVNAEDIQSPVVNAVPSAEQLAQQTFIADASMRLNAGIAAAEAELKKVDDALAKVKPDDTAGLKAQVEALSNAFHAMLAAESSTRQPREG